MKNGERNGQDKISLYLNCCKKTNIINLNIQIDDLTDKLNAIEKKDNEESNYSNYTKENPDESFVYVLQHPPQNINILTASDYGYLVICLPENSQQMLFSPAPFIQKMRKNLQDFKE